MLLRNTLLAAEVGFEPTHTGIKIQGLNQLDDSATFYFAELFLRSVDAFICLSAYLDICVAKKSQQKKGKNVGHHLKKKKTGTSAMFQCLYVFHLSAQRNHSLTRQLINSVVAVWELKITPPSQNFICIF